MKKNYLELRILIRFLNLANDEIKWHLIITKTFDFILPSTIVYQSLQIAFDVIDIIANNSVENNKKISLDTSVIREETLIFNCIFFSFYTL